MKSNQDQFTSTKFIGTFILNQDLIACLIDKSMVVQLGQWVRFNGENHQIIGVSYFGISLRKGEFVQLVTVEALAEHVKDARDRLLGVNMRHDAKVVRGPLIGGA
jgi:hypothetical protein